MLRFRARAPWLYGWPADELVGRRRARRLSRAWTRGLLSTCEPTVEDQQPSPLDAVVWPSGPLLHLALCDTLRVHQHGAVNGPAGRNGTISQCLW